MNRAVRFLSGIIFAIPAVGVVGGVYFAISKIAQMKSSNRQLVTLDSLGNENCQIIDPLKILKEKSQKDGDYYSMFCRNVGIHSDFYIPRIFKVAFPKSLFKDQNLVKGQIIDLKGNIEIEDITSVIDIKAVEDKITFSSNQFKESSPLTGKLKYQVFNSQADNTIQGGIVKLDDSKIDKNIYLDWEQYRYR